MPLQVQWKIPGRHWIELKLFLSGVLHQSLLTPNIGGNTGDWLLTMFQVQSSDQVGVD